MFIITCGKCAGALNCNKSTNLFCGNNKRKSQLQENKIVLIKYEILHYPFGICLQGQRTGDILQYYPGGGLFNSQQTPKEDKSVLDRNIYAYKRNSGSMTKGGSNTAKSKRKEMCCHKMRYK